MTTNRRTIGRRDVHRAGHSVRQYRGECPCLPPPALPIDGIGVLLAADTIPTCSARPPKRHGMLALAAAIRRE